MELQRRLGRFIGSQRLARSTGLRQSNLDSFPLHPVTATSDTHSKEVRYILTRVAYVSASFPKSRSFTI